MLSTSRFFSPHSFFFFLAFRFVIGKQLNFFFKEFYDFNLCLVCQIFFHIYFLYCLIFILVTIFFVRYLLRGTFFNVLFYVFRCLWCFCCRNVFKKVKGHGGVDQFFYIYFFFSNMTWARQRKPIKKLERYKECSQIYQQMFLFFSASHLILKAFPTSFSFSSLEKSVF